MAGTNHRSAQVLLLLVIPGQLVFLYAIHLMKESHNLPSVLLTVAFLSASLIQVSQTNAIFFLCALPKCLTISIISVSQVFFLLCIADYMVHCLWRRGKDPDSYSIPYLTALGDLLGTALLSLAFLMLWWVGDSGNVQVQNNKKSSIKISNNILHCGKSVDERNDCGLKLQSPQTKHVFRKTFLQHNASRTIKEKYDEISLLSYNGEIQIVTAAKSE